MTTINLDKDQKAMLTAAAQNFSGAARVNFVAQVHDKLASVRDVTKNHVRSAITAVLAAGK
ncbi:MAG: hypothetical protein JWL86_3180 [Rhizobium sp.]|nr:hypothetical protein [Rhizobium sp.]